MSFERLNCDVLVIGSGPGGAVTAAFLAEAGRDVLLVEEGKHIPVGQVPSFSLTEMELKYRYGGLAVAMGKTKVSYLEGCCVGGASEINAGLYNRPLAQTLDAWAQEYNIRDFSSKSLESFFAANEQQMSIECFPVDVPIASQTIRAAAKCLNWKALEIPRMWDYKTNRRQSMSETFIPRFLKAGGRLRSQQHIERLIIKGGRAVQAVGKNGHIDFNHVFVCGGAIQTPFLLQKSGIRRNVGNALRMHPAVRVAAVFDHDVNDPQEGVPVYQVSEFKPRITLGGSYSGQAHLALWLAGREDCTKRVEQYKRMAIFYTLITTEATGTVRALPLLRDALVNLPMAQGDWDVLRQGLARLEELLKAAGAVEIFVPKDIELSTIHLFSSCPMGEDQTKCAVDSYGKLHGFENAYANDASILPSTPGVNPQAVIMAIARRNAQHFLGAKK